MEWMKKHNPVLFDLVENKIQVGVKGKRVELKGVTEEGTLRSMSSTGVKQLLKKTSVMGTSLHGVSQNRGVIKYNT